MSGAIHHCVVTQLQLTGNMLIVQAESHALEGDASLSLELDPIPYTRERFWQVERAFLELADPGVQPLHLDGHHARLGGVVVRVRLADLVLDSPWVRRIHRMRDTLTTSERQLKCFSERQSGKANARPR